MNKHILNQIKTFFIVAFIAILPIVAAFADSSTPPDNQTSWEKLISLLSNSDFQKILINIEQQIPYLINFVLAISYVSGIALIVSGVNDMRIYGQAMSMMRGNTTMLQPLGKMAIGAMLIFLPGTIDTLVYTVWMEASENIPLSYDSTTSQTPGNLPIDVLNAVAAFLRLFGYIAIVHGLNLLSKAMKQGAQQGQYGKAILQIIGGVLAVNIIETTEMIWSTLFSP
jgi:hypothetical protein